MRQIVVNSEAEKQTLIRNIMLSEGLTYKPAWRKSGARLDWRAFTLGMVTILAYVTIITVLVSVFS